jgi:uncharacterized membrane protein
MKFLAKMFFRGLAALLPLVLTGYALYLAVAAGERILRSVVLLFVPETSYWPGMGFALSIVVVTAIGLLSYSWVVRTVYGRLTSLLERIPVVKTVYGMIVDVVRLIASEEERPFRRVVAVRLDSGLEQIGFVTREEFADMPGLPTDRVAVYLPMSYQLGGFTVLVARERITELSMSVEDALRFCVTAGVSTKAEGSTPRKSA